MSTKPETGFGIDAESTLDALIKPLDLIVGLVTRIQNLVQRLNPNPPKQ